MPSLLIAALETSSGEGSVAVLEDDVVLAEEALGEGTRHGAALHPALSRCLEAAGRKPADLGLVVVGTGPGSYTGMRVGVAAARSLAFAVDCPVVGVCSFDVLAAMAPAEEASVAVARDARRARVYFALYGPAAGNGERDVVREPVHLPVEEAAGLCPEGTLLMGDGGSMMAAAGSGLRVAEGEPDAASAARLAGMGLRRFRKHGAPDPAEVLPLYLQEPYATPRRKEPSGG